jgi:hypothetical protein
MARRSWSLAVAGLALGGLAIAGGTVIGGELGPLTAGYGFLIGLAALYALAGLAIRARFWRRLPTPRAAQPMERLAGRRVF